MANELILYGSVGARWWDEDFFTSADVVARLADMSGPITVRLNSGGGIAHEGMAIYSALAAYPDEVHVIVDSMAASAASLIAMAGDRITMRLGSVMMIHDPAQPWTEERGTADDHLRLAKALNVVGGAYADVYAKKSGTGRDEARAVMKDETFMDGPEAIALGFATDYDPDSAAVVAAKFDYRIYKNAPAALRVASEGLGQHAPGRAAVMAMLAGKPRLNRKQEKTMAKVSQMTAANDAVDGDDEDDEGTAVEVVDTAAVTAKARGAVSAAVTAERSRVMRIRQSVAVAGLGAEMADKLIADGTSFEAATDQITAAWKGKGDVDTQMAGPARAKVGMEAREKQVKGVELALMAKAGIKGGERNEFTSLSMAELAREFVMASGHSGRFSNRQEMVGHAFTMSGMHTTSDFANVLANVMGKAALQGWEEAAETFEQWTRKGTLTDFKATKRVGAGLFTALDAMAEGAEYKYGTVGDRGEPITLATYGKGLRISRQAIINDDLNILGSLPIKMGRAAKATIGNLVYAILTANPNMADGVALFHANHANLLTGGGSALAVAGLSAARAAMRVMKESYTTGQPLNIAPKYLIVPAALETTANQLINSTVDPTASKGHAVNPVGGMATVIADGRLDAASTTAWYLAADPAGFDTIEVAYLDGNDAPYLEQQASWSVDGVEMKVRIDAGVAPLDAHTLQKNAGA